MTVLVRTSLARSSPRPNRYRRPQMLHASKNGNVIRRGPEALYGGCAGHTYTFEAVSHHNDFRTLYQVCRGRPCGVLGRGYLNNPCRIHKWY